MDTYHNVDSFKCLKCYECIKLCTQLNKEVYGKLGFMTFDYDGTPYCEIERPPCHHCETEIKGKKIRFPCNTICPTRAMQIKRY